MEFVAKNTDNPFDDDLFEPFELEDEPSVSRTDPSLYTAPPRVEQYTPEANVPTVRCQSCGAPNPAHNRHCEECGARLGKGPLPVAAPPMSRSTPGGRALGVLGGVVLLVALIALFMNLWGGGNGTATPEDNVSTTAAIEDPVEQVAIAPASVDASSHLEGYEAARLIDGDVSTYWNDQSARGVDAQLTFVFAQPVALSEMEFTNIQQRNPFRQNYRIKDIEVTVDDLELQLTFTLPDSSDPHRITLDTLRTTRLTVRVLTTYPGEPVGDSPAFDELALAEVRFFGVFAE
ncbi:MAG: NADase-type glycan-binding domain-containing protein [Acidimicrobiia bacterium]